MAHFALIVNDIVENVVVVADEHEHRGQDFLAIDLGLGGEWIQASYNTKEGVYYDPETNEPAEDQSKALRYTYPAIGYSYDRKADEFRAPAEP